MLVTLSTTNVVFCYSIKKYIVQISLSIIFFYTSFAGRVALFAFSGTDVVVGVVVFLKLSVMVSTKQKKLLINLLHGFFSII